MKEVCIIGGGVIGLCCAYYLQEAGIEVFLIEKNNFSDGCSFGNAGMIVPSHFIPMASPGIIAKGMEWMFKKKSPFYIRPRLNLELLQWLWKFYRSANEKHVIESAPLLRDLHLEGREFYARLNQSAGFDFGFENKGILMLYQSADIEKEEEEMAEMAYTLGIEANKLSHTGVQQLDPQVRIDVRGGIHYPGDAHLIPQKFMEQMYTHLQQSGVVFRTGHTVTAINDMGKNGTSIKLDNGMTIDARNVVIACGSWSGKLMRQMKFSLPMQDGKGYSMTYPDVESKPFIPSILIERRVAITPMGNDLRISGTLEISGMEDKINPHKVNAILEAVPEYYPDLKLKATQKVWYGYRPCSPDGLPYIGRWKKDSTIMVATGHAMMGLSLAPATGRMIREIILKKSLPVFLNKLSPSRFSKR